MIDFSDWPENNLSPFLATFFAKMTTTPFSVGDVWLFGPTTVKLILIKHDISDLEAS